jgi:hypothetical protein
MTRTKPVSFDSIGYPAWLFFYSSALDLPDHWINSPRRFRSLGEPERRDDERVCSNCRVAKKVDKFRKLVTGAYNSWCIECKTAIEQTRRKKRAKKYELWQL